MSGKKKIMLLGGSAQQVPVIEKAGEMGLETILVDYLPDNPGHHVSDKWYKESTTDIPKLIEIAEKEKISGILAYASDPAAIPAAVVAEKLNLPGNPLKSVEILGYKHLFRKFLKENGFACPDFIVIEKGEGSESMIEGIQSLNFPLVVKPTDSSGSKGVTVVSDEADFLKAIETAMTFSRNGILIVEEFIKRGHKDIIGGDIVVSRGEVKLWGLMTAIRGNNGESIIPVGEKFPDNLPEETRNRVKSELQRMISLLEIKAGELNVEIIIGENGEVYLLELGPRAGGNMIPLQIGDIYGCDILRLLIGQAMGEEEEMRIRDPEGVTVTYVVHSEVSGSLKGVAIDEKLRMFLYRTALYKQPGDEVEVFDGASKALGILFFKFPDEAIYKECFSNVDEKVIVLT